MQDSSDNSENDVPLLEHSLLQWGLSAATVKNFQDNEITFTLLDDIQESELKELIPSIKERILFRRGLNKLNDIIHDTASEDTNSLCSIDVCSTSSGNSSSELTDCKKLTANEKCHEESDLTSILKTTTCGELCLASVNKSIDMTIRNHITKTIVEYYIKQYGSMSSRDFEDMSSQIIILFPSECKETYYVPSRKYSAKSYIPARGKLVDRYHNQKRTLRKTAVFKTAQHAVDKSDTTGESGISTTVTAEDIEEHKLWLKFNKEPFVEILEKWHNTRACRMEYVACHENTIHDILSEWPSLKLSLGYKLIETDFDAMHPNRGLNLFKKWPIFMVKALPHLKKLKSSEVNILDENPVEDARDYIYFKLLAHKMPPTVKVPIRDNDNKKKKLYKPSIVESQNAFILHVTNQSEIKNKLDQCQKVHLSRGTTFQPLIVTVGPTTKDIKDFYVAVEHVLYKMDSMLKAVDVCFKAIHVLNAQYPMESKQSE